MSMIQVNTSPLADSIPQRKPLGLSRPEWFLRARCFVTKEKRPASVHPPGAEYHQASFRPPFRQGLHNNLGFCYLMMGKLKEAEHCLQAATKKDRSLQPAFHNLAIVDWRMSMKEKRLPDVSYIETAIALNPQTGDLFFDAAMIYARAANFASRQEVQGLETSYLERAQECCRQAARQGLPQQRFDLLVRLYLRLDEMARPEDLQALRPTTKSPSRSIRLIDPLDGLEMSLQLRIENIR